MGRRSRYTAEFKADAVASARHSGRPLQRVADDLGVSRETLRGWLHQDAVDRGEGAPGELTSAEREELLRLRREVTELHLEREILKKVVMAPVSATRRDENPPRLPSPRSGG